MKGFKPTGYGPSAGFKFPARMGFTGSTGAVTPVAGYTRRRFAEGGYVRQDNPRMKAEIVGDSGSALVRRARSSTNLDQESGGKTPLRPGFADGGSNWIAGATKNKGALHRALGVPEGKKIPAKKLAKAAKSSNPTMRKRASLAKTLGAMRKADGGQVNEQEKKRMDSVQRTSLESKEEAGMLSNAEAAQLAKMRASEKAPVKKAGGGRITRDEDGIPRRENAYTLGESLRAVPSALREAGRYAVSGIRNAMWNRQRTVGGRNESVGEYVDRASSGKMASNYAKGGKAKRMGYMNGGLGMSGPSRVTAMPPGRMQSPRMPVRPMMMRSKGGKTQRMGYANGGGVTAAEAKRIAERTVGEHVRYPAPKGHKGFERLPMFGRK